jgi:hypothetical protein
MRIAAIYEMHAVLQEIGQVKVDCLVVGGDVLPGPLPSETIQCLLDLDIPKQFIFAARSERTGSRHCSGAVRYQSVSTPDICASTSRSPLPWTVGL